VAKKTKHIPEYQLPPSVNDGVHVVSYKEFGFNDLHDTSEPHRDEHYLLMVSCGGSVEAVIDFDNINISKPFIGLISPAQVHHVINANITEGYAISFNEELMPPELKPILETYFLQERIFSDNNPILCQATKLVYTILSKNTTEMSTTKTILNGTILSILIFFSVLFITVLLQINSPLNRQVDSTLNIGFPFIYYNQFLVDPPIPNSGWNGKNLIVDFLFVWLIVVSLYAIVLEKKRIKQWLEDNNNYT
jgi:hypothetical protein